MSRGGHSRGGHNFKPKWQQPDGGKDELLNRIAAIRRTLPPDQHKRDQDLDVIATRLTALSDDEVRAAYVMVIPAIARHERDVRRERQP